MSLELKGLFEKYQHTYSYGQAFQRAIIAEANINRCNDPYLKGLYNVEYNDFLRMAELIEKEMNHG